MIQIVTLMALFFILPVYSEQGVPTKPEAPKFVEGLGGTFAKFPLKEKLLSELRQKVGSERAGHLAKILDDYYPLELIAEVAKRYNAEIEASRQSAKAGDHDAENDHLSKASEILKGDSLDPNNINLKLVHEYLNFLFGQSGVVRNEAQRSEVIESLAGEWVIRDISKNYTQYRLNLSELDKKFEEDSRKWDVLQKELAKQAAELEKRRRESDFAKRYSNDQKNRIKGLYAMANEDNEKLINEAVARTAPVLKASGGSLSASPDQLMKAFFAYIGKTADSTNLRKTVADNHVKNAAKHILNSPISQKVVEPSTRTEAILKALEFLSSDTEGQSKRQYQNAVSSGVSSALFLAMSRTSTFKKIPGAKKALVGIGALSAGLSAGWLYTGYQSETLINARKARIALLKQKPIYKLLKDSMQANEADLFLDSWENDGKSSEELVVNYISDADRKWLDEQAKIEAQTIENIFATTPDHYISDAKSRKEAALFVGYRRAALRVLMREMSREDQALFDQIFQEQTNRTLDQVTKKYKEFTNNEKLIGRQKIGSHKSR